MNKSVGDQRTKWLVKKSQDYRNDFLNTDRDICTFCRNSLLNERGFSNPGSFATWAFNQFIMNVLLCS
ncbi:hypothetical protein [Chitinophaga eiseniae]|uniref:Uncharacterized protein n=1 Tax=Chitinophaga eiseniae TaxID=634771 RepID=A0A847SE10_9BACT|nr:hypothetical protein [Chitinophaga eiseniae]NLR78003.1 hypothetical protein [Chitinophaga eiseniae]